MSPSSPFSSQGPVLIIGAVLFVCILGYTLFVASPYLLGPSLTLVSPINGETVTASTVTISGKTERVSYLSVNGLPVPLLEDGAFLIERSFPTGYTVVVIRARDRFGRESVETIRFLNTFNPSRHGVQKERRAEVESEGN
jgi:hypothetical protein